MRVTTVPILSPQRPGSVDAIELAATLYLPGAAVALPVPGLVVGHGAGSNRVRHEDFCREACAQGFAVLALDFRGHGGSDGTADGPLELDISAGAAFLAGQPEVNGAQLCYRGSSMGGFYGLKVAAEMDFAAIALLCPANERVMLDALDEADDERSDNEWPASGPAQFHGDASEGGGAARPHGDGSAGGAAQPAASTRWDVPLLKKYFERQDSLALAARVRCPVLLIHARGDSVVPFDHSLALVGRLAGDATLLALAGGSHTSAQHDPQIHRATALWLRDQVRSACTGRT
jgi:dipeptidyl aminopeptidase/acylaminoacyl peptidase